MLTLITGIPGSGKSYYAVHMISRLKKKARDKVIHNIDGLKLGLDIYDFCEENGIEPIELFLYSFHKNDDRFRGYLFVFDECQDLFPTDLRNKEVFKFFQYHRKFGVDVILLSQDYKLVSQKVTLISEKQLRASSDTSNPLPFLFTYKKMVGTEQIGREWVLKKQSVFDLYKTADFDQKKVRKKARPMMILLVGITLMVLLVPIILIRWVGSKKQIDPEREAIKSEQLRQSNKLIEEKYSNSSNRRYDSTHEYPASLVDVQNGIFAPLDTIDENGQIFIVFLDVLYPKEAFPYPVVVTKLGYSAVLPLDAYAYYTDQKTKSFDRWQDYDPNERYYYQEAGGSSNFNKREYNDEKF